MAKIKKIGIELLFKLKSEQIPPPNELTVGMGLLLKKAREDLGWSQSKLAKLIFSRQSTISDIEKGKNEIGILTLAILSLRLGKPIAYFFPEGFVKGSISGITSPGQQEMLDMFHEIELLGGSEFTLKQMKFLLDNFREEYDEDGTNYPPDDAIEETQSDEYEV